MGSSKNREERGRGICSKLESTEPQDRPTEHWIIGVGLVPPDEEVWSHFLREARNFIAKHRDHRGQQQRGRIAGGVRGDQPRATCKWAICEMVK